MKRIKLALVAVFALVGVMGAAGVVTSQYASASPAGYIQQGVNDSGGSGQKLQPVIKNVVNVILYAIGVAAVIMIVIGGLRYVVSGGDSSGVSGAKNTILYAVVGLVIAIMAYAIVNFVLTQFK